MNTFETLVGQKMFYSDKETGVGWEIEVFDAYHSMERAGVNLILTDNIRVNLSYIDNVRGYNHIIDKIMEKYENEINNLEYKNG